MNRSHAPVRRAGTGIDELERSWFHREEKGEERAEDVLLNLEHVGKSSSLTFYDES